jgi:hypothetical protein
MKNEREKSDPSIVAKRSANKPKVSEADLWGGWAEPVEPREGTEGKTEEQHTCRTPSRERGRRAPRFDYRFGVSQRLERGGWGRKSELRTAPPTAATSKKSCLDMRRTNPHRFQLLVRRALHVLSDLPSRREERWRLRDPSALRF